jgi:hypothetical protein
VPGARQQAEVAAQQQDRVERPSGGRSAVPTTAVTPRADATSTAPGDGPTPVTS